MAVIIELNLRRQQLTDYSWFSWHFPRARGSFTVSIHRWIDEMFRCFSLWLASGVQFQPFWRCHVQNVSSQTSGRTRRAGVWAETWCHWLCLCCRCCFLAALAAPSLQCIRVSSYSLDAEGLAHFHSPHCVDKRRQTDEKKQNGRRSTLTSTSPPWRQFALRSTGNEAHRGNTTWDVLSLEKKNDLLVSALDIVHRTEMILLHPHLLSGNSVLTPPEAGANVLVTVCFFSLGVCECVLRGVLSNTKPTQLAMKSFSISLFKWDVQGRLVEVTSSQSQEMIRMIRLIGTGLVRFGSAMCSCLQTTRKSNEDVCGGKSLRWPMGTACNLHLLCRGPADNTATGEPSFVAEEKLNFNRVRRRPCVSVAFVYCWK